MSLSDSPVTASEVSAASGVATSTTAFTPGAGSMVRVIVIWLFATNYTGGVTFTCKDSSNTSYTQTVAESDVYGSMYQLIFDHQYTSSPGSITVKITASATGAADALIEPHVITGQNTSQTGAATATGQNGSSSASAEITITTTKTGSLVHIAGGVDYGSATTAIAGTTTGTSWNDGTAGDHGVTGISSSTTGTPGSETFGWTLSPHSTYGYGIAAAEVLPAGSGESGSFAVSLPTLSTSITAALSHEHGTFTPVLPTLATSLSGTVTHKGTFAVVLPALSASINGVAQHTESGSLAIVLPTLQTDISNIPHERGPLSIVLPRLATSLAGTAQHSESGPLHIVLPTLVSGLAGGQTSYLAGTYKWNGTIWVPYQLGTQGIGNGAVTAQQVAANSLQAANVGFVAAGIAGINVFIDPPTPYDWTFNPTSGTTTSFVTSNAALTGTTPLALGDTFSNSSGLGGPFTVTSITPNGSNVTVGFTPTATSAFAATDTLYGGTPSNMWFNSTAGYQLSVWANGTWETAQFGTGAIAPASITTAQIVAGAVTAEQIAANTITAAQIAAETITAAEIAANTITGDLIAANTITGDLIAGGTISADLLVSGIVVAGIVDTTTINSATFVGSTFQGSNWLEDVNGEFFYGGTPSTGNLFVSITASSGTDPYHNTVENGITIYGSTGNMLRLYVAADVSTLSYPSGAGSESSSAAAYMAVAAPGASNELIQFRITGPTSTYDSLGCAIIMDSSAANGATVYTGYMEAGTGTSATWTEGLFQVTHSLTVNGATGGAIVEVIGNGHFTSDFLVDGVLSASNFSGSYAGGQGAVTPLSGTVTVTQCASAINGIISRLQSSGLMA